MKPIFSLLFTLLAGAGICSGQLVTKKDFDAAFALQAGMGSGTAFPNPRGGLKAEGRGGLKMTFPFTRVWFLGAEINYNRLRTENRLKTAESGAPEAVFRYDVSSVQIPVYARMMLRNNKTSLLFGGYYARHFDGKIDRKYDDGFRREPYGPESGSAGVVAGVEQIIGRNLYVTFTVNGSLTNMAPKEQFGSRLHPVQASLTVSYDLLRIGDCGCY
ncbi:MAG: PorT family protein [Culturomica sp.]|jgi:hypothetical protein|nr:PorT family protein [Culturomica sp.]